MLKQRHYAAYTKGQSDSEWEQAYRRGMSDGAAIVLDLLNKGECPDDLVRYVDDLRAWAGAEAMTRGYAEIEYPLPPCYRRQG